MATKKSGILTHAPSWSAWWKHLRRSKHTFWKGERKAAKHEAQRQSKDQQETTR